MIACAFSDDPLVRRWNALFAPVDWAAIDAPSRPGVACGPVPQPPSAYLKALVIKVHEGFSSSARLHAYLAEHPALTRSLGFCPRSGRAAAPSARRLRQQQQRIDADLLTRVLAQTVQIVRREAPDLGRTVAIDVTHIYAHVRENNPKESIAHIYATTHKPRGDRDCALGVKTRANQAGAGGGKTYLFGYGCGMAAAPSVYGDVALAVHTQPFNRQEITHFRPLYAGAAATLGAPPANLAVDAAFDAWFVSEAGLAAGGIAAVAPNRRSPAPLRSPEGHPLCAKGFVMTPTSSGRHEDGYRIQRSGCPLRGSGAVCDHARFARGGCVKRINTEPGGLLRATIDRTDPAYLAVSRQRTCVERISSQAKALDLERPKLRTLAAVARLALLTALTINLRLINRNSLHHPPPT